MQVTLAIYERRERRRLRWVTLGLGPFSVDRTGRGPARLRERIAAELRQKLAKAEPEAFSALRYQRGLELCRVHLELTLRGSARRKVAGRYPLVLETHDAGGGRRLRIGYHPDRQDEWFAVDEGAPLELQASGWFRKQWADLDTETLEDLPITGRDELQIVHLDLRPLSPIDRIDADKERARREPENVLDAVGVDLTLRAVEDRLPPGLPREPMRSRLQSLLASDPPRPTVLVGRPGSGRTTLLARAMLDRLDADDYPSHANLDRVHHFWSLSGQRLIAGQTHVGEWEGRAGDLLGQVRGARIVLVVEDLHTWGRVGQSRESTRSLADFFRIPLAKGEVVMVGEATPEQWDRLQDEAPAFAGLFEVLHVPDADLEDTRRMLLHAIRQLERDGQTFGVGVHSRLLSLGDRLLSARARPGRVVELLAAFRDVRGHVNDDEVARALSALTGLPRELLEPRRAVTEATERRALRQRVMGQPEAIEAAVDLVMRVRAGLTDPSRPYAVYLFTGPTGTGKTELARLLAVRLFGDSSRLLRFDMSEFNGPDGPARLVGDRHRPEGLLVSRVRAQPFAVLLLDEIEKAHRAVLNLLLQVFDEGRLTDAAGRTADFTQTVVVMTSNLGARHRPASGFSRDPDGARLDVEKAVRAFFAPELFNRIDRVVPFGPLARDAARAITRKELWSLLRRRGLVDRDVFVRPTSSVLDRVVEHAFDARDGARPLKRYLEREIGALLAGEIAREPQASLRLIRLYVRDDRFQTRVSRLREAEPLEAPLALEAHLDQPIEALQAALPEALAFLDGVEGETLERLSRDVSRHLAAFAAGETARADPLHALDEMRDELAAFRGRVEAQMAAGVADEDEPDRVADELAQVDARARLFDPKMLTGPPRPTRRALLATLAEVHLLRRLLARADDPSAHAVRIELQSLGSGDGGLMHRLVGAYVSGRVTFVGAACHFVDRVVRVDSVGALRKEAPRARHVLLDVVGLGVRDLLEHDTGVHLWQSPRHETQIVSVRVEPFDAEDDAVMRLEARAALELAYLSALEAGEPAEDPTELMPAVRRFRSARVTDDKGAPMAIEVEDYRAGYAATLHARHIGEIMPQLWLLRASRRAP